jgi:hypothetical protein
MLQQIVANVKYSSTISVSVLTYTFGTEICNVKKLFMWSKIIVLTKEHVKKQKGLASQGHQKIFAVVFTLDVRRRRCCQRSALQRSASIFIVPSHSLDPPATVVKQKEPSQKNAVIMFSVVLTAYHRDQ